MGINLSIKNVPETLAEKLRQRAVTNHRSLQGELMALLEATCGGGDHASRGQSRAATNATNATKAASIAEIGTKLRQICPVNSKIPENQTSANIVRRMRDGRDGTQWPDPKHHQKGF